MKYKATCPICGWSLIQASPNSQINISCPKCKSYLSVEVEENGVRVCACQNKSTKKILPT